MKAALQHALDAPRGSWLLLPGADWAALVALKSSPRPSWLHPFDRRAWDRAMAEGLRRGRVERALELTALPLWWGDNDDEEPGGDWQLRLSFVDEEGRVVADLDVGEDEALRVRAKLQCTKVELSFVSAGTSYAPGVPGVEPFPPFVLVTALVRLVIDDVLTATPVPRGEAPIDALAPFSTQVRPAFSPEDEATRVLLGRVIARGSFSASDPTAED